ncbi:MAG: hypothetical protein ACD_79C00818G0002 [uncultured bacterium]|nr:MAG: hypothetical protein ACD_79C00818G0002 [uncultured bacterium]
MISLVNNKTYRNDIDGLRAIAVLAVIAFHLGYISNGFLGVDVFFVISGFLITGIIYNEMANNVFSLVNFYLRRIRRIIPLALFISLVSLITGIATMLPDDLENLAQSVIATNLFSNNILQAMTTKNYWDVVNEFKPLMHTWSLGVEEQYYLLYPLLFILVPNKNRIWLLPVLLVLAAGSLILYLSSYQEFCKFYFIFFRFWELAVGGIAAIALKNRLINHKYSILLILFLISLLCFDFYFVTNELTLLITVFLTLGILVTSNSENIYSSIILDNKLLGFIGKISFSMYMWHQVLLAYTRYFVVKELKTKHLIAIFILTLSFSVISYFIIEKPFRNKGMINTVNLFWILGSIFFLTNVLACYIYINAGILKDIPELNVSKSQTVRNLHAKYNARIREYDVNFKKMDRINVLVIGNSFARDWGNVLLESKYADIIQISYIEEPDMHKELKTRADKADIIYYYNPVLLHTRKLGIQEKKLWVVGTKNFGTSNGIFYNYKGNDYYKQRTSLAKGFLETNKRMLKEWNGKYIDYIGKVIDDNQTVPVFTPFHKFISQDCRHLTKAGAQYYAQLFEHEFEHVFDKKNK